VNETLHTIHVRINDAATGQPTPCRIRFTGPQGDYFAPFGRLARFAPDSNVDVGGNVLIGSEPSAYIDGTCEIRLPAGPLTVAISKGPEYKPLLSNFILSPGKLALRFELERWIDLRAERWYSGDTRSHFLTPHAALLEGAAEDVAVVNLLAWPSLVFGANGRQYPTISNILAFSGQRPALETPGHLVVVNTMNLHPVLGRLILLNCHRVVYPLAFGGPEGWDNWTLGDWCDQCHRKRGLVIGDGFFGNYPGHPHGELLADLILEKVDALQMGDFENPDADTNFQQESVLKEWYQLLDCGFRLPLVGGSDKEDNLGVLGNPRTYAHLAPGQEFTYQNWIEAVRAGRTFVTNGPMIALTVNGHEPGAVIDLPSASQTVHIRAEAKSWVPLDFFEVVANHSVVRRAAGSGSPTTSVIEMEVNLPASAWLVARCWATYDHAAEQWVGAQTSPVYVHVDGKPLRAKAETIARLTGQLEQMLDWVRREGRFESDRQRDRLTGIFESAREVLDRRASG
jgi:hypothetical protein